MKVYATKLGIAAHGRLACRRAAEPSEIGQYAARTVRLAAAHKRDDSAEHGQARARIVARARRVQLGTTLTEAETADVEATFVIVCTATRNAQHRYA
jgi:hypothetical protein